MPSPVNHHLTPADLLPAAFILSATSNDVLPRNLNVKTVHNLLSTYCSIALPYTPSQHLATTVLRAHPELTTNDLLQIGLIMGRAVLAEGASPHERGHAARHIVTSAALAGDRGAANFMFEGFRKLADDPDDKHPGSYRLKWEKEVVTLLRGHARGILRDLKLVAGINETAALVELGKRDVDKVDLEPAVLLEKKRSGDPIWAEEIRAAEEKVEAERKAKEEADKNPSSSSSSAETSPAKDDEPPAAPQSTTQKNRDRLLRESLGQTLHHFATILKTPTYTASPLPQPTIHALYRLAGRFGFGKAWHDLGVDLIQQSDTAGATAAWRAGCNCDDLLCFYALSTVLPLGQTFNEQEECLLTAAASGVIPAAHNLGYLYGTFRTGAARDVDAALEWYRTCGVEGGMKSSLLAGIRLLVLEKRDMRRAKEWLGLLGVNIHLDDNVSSEEERELRDELAQKKEEFEMAILHVICTNDEICSPFMCDYKGGVPRTAAQQDAAAHDTPLVVNKKKRRKIKRDPVGAVQEPAQEKKKKPRLTKEELLERKIKRLLSG